MARLTVGGKGTSAGPERGRIGQCRATNAAPEARSHLPACPLLVSPFLTQWATDRGGRRVAVREVYRSCENDAL